MDPRLEELLRRLALNDETALESALRADLSSRAHDGVDAKTGALVRLAGLIALRSAGTSYEWSVSAALAAGATDAEIVGVLVAVAPVVGVARMNSASTHIATALGHDLDLPNWE